MIRLLFGKPFAAFEIDVCVIYNIPPPRRLRVCALVYRHCQLSMLVFSYCLPACLSVYLSVYLSICLSVSIIYLSSIYLLSVHRFWYRGPEIHPAICPTPIVFRALVPRKSKKEPPRLIPAIAPQTDPPSWAYPSKTWVGTGTASAVTLNLSALALAYMYVACLPP